jgi:hypothetical protein
MAFTFVVEDGTMVPNSNSYISVEDATDYLVTNIHASPAWVALPTLSQQLLLAWATRYLDSRAVWNGIPTSDFLANPTATNVIGTWAVFPPTGTVPPPQSLRWPRAGAFDCDSIPIASDTIPKQLKAATAEMARYLIENDRSLERPQDGLTELKVDVITLKFRDYQLPIVPNEISYILRGLGTISSGRTNFSKITRV